MRERRPGRYSDSSECEVDKPSRSLLEYHLETLTSRNQHGEFELLARRVAERAICPNLLPQTGPTGGGDSKVDSETFPVSEEIAETWYQGNSSATERWAFAFSAKQDWKPKIRSDVSKIVATERGYPKCFFITNQFVSDKKRSETEDALSKEHSIDVRLLDRNWVCEQIEKFHLWQITGSILDIKEFTEWQRNLGPQDERRVRELKDLDEQAADPSRYSGIKGQQALDCIASARIAAELERSRHEVDGRYTAAIRLARSSGEERYLIRALYSHAWTGCFYFDDHALVASLYSEMEPLCFKSEKASEISDLINLWNVLSAGVATQALGFEETDLQGKFERLERSLLELALDESRPNNSAEAALLLHSLRLSNSARTEKLEDAPNHLLGMKEVFEKSQGLGAFPFRQYEKFVLETDELFGEIDGFEELYDCVLNQAAERSSEQAVGERLVKTAWSRLENQKFTSAIRAAGKAKSRLNKEECQDELFDSLALLGLSYEAIGLHWAGRASLYAAVSFSFHVQDDGNSFHPRTWLLIQRLCWSSLKEGRIDEVLIGMMLAHKSLETHPEREQRLPKFADFVNHLDAVLSILILKTPIENLATFTQLHDHLEELCFEQSRSALLFCLGYIPEAKKILSERMNIQAECNDFFVQMVDQPAAKDLPESAETYLSEDFTLTSKILGAEVTIKSKRIPRLWFLAESVLACLESFFSTGFSFGLTPIRERINLLIEVPEQDLENGYSITAKEDALLIQIDQSSTDYWGTTRNVFLSMATELIARILTKDFIMSGGETALKKFFEDEESHIRASIFIDVCESLRHLCCGFEIGSKDCFKTSEELKPFPVKRKSHWLDPSKGKTRNGDEDSSQDSPLTPKSELPHDKVSFKTLIDYHTWNTASWRGVLFSYFPGKTPLMSFIFEEDISAKKIFRDWRDKFGKKDLNESLNISIITGISRHLPSHYRVVLGLNLDGLKQESKNGEVISTMGRVQLMEPANSENLNAFLREFNSASEYYLCPSAMSASERVPRIFEELKILKRNLTILPAWKVQLNTPEIMGIQPDDDPLIPDNEDNPPILDVIEFLKNKKSRM